jgi:hypothetical protein
MPWPAIHYVLVTGGCVDETDVATCQQAAPCLPALIAAVVTINICYVAMVCLAFSVAYDPIAFKGNVTTAARMFGMLVRFTRFHALTWVIQSG